MSHFTVMVIGENPEEQLQPFSENIEVPEYKDEDGETTTYNPKSKWDWYLLGGRWTGFLKAKNMEMAEVGRPGIMTPSAESEWCDQTTKGNIDFEAMRKHDADKAAKHYDRAYSIFGDLPENKTFAQIIKDFGDKKREEARDVYWNQPRCEAWKSNKDRHNHFGFMESPDDFLIPREQYINNAANSAISTHAILKDGEWYERGQMGWWGVCHNEKDEAEWNKKVTELLNGLSDDTLISIYACHI